MMDSWGHGRYIVKRTGHGGDGWSWTQVSLAGRVSRLPDDLTRKLYTLYTMNAFQEPVEKRSGCNSRLFTEIK